MRIKPTGDSLLGNVAPSYDHASSLGRKLRDEQRIRILEEDCIDRYVKKGCEGIYWSAGERRGPSPLELIRRAYQEYPALYRPFLDRIAALNVGQLNQVVARIPRKFMSAPAKRFAMAFMEYSYGQLANLRG